ncbi:hypothetical protein PVAG01_04093 [Phlyctema vagabunda]|uniref:Uncharacterized protein n=1 Tax=Phlyctema vagabunda TaxID=108571 RepID=A0ABR4PN94_9HELO
MFCTSLRKRKEWETVPPALLACKTSQWIEKSIGTHDLSIPVPHQPRTPQLKDWFGLLLLSAVDMQSPLTMMGRIERLCHQKGGQDVGIVFLLTQQSVGGSGVASYMDFQSRVVRDFDIPIFPLSSISSLQTSLQGLHRQLVQTRCAPVPAPVSPLTALLPFCSTNPPIPEHSRNVLSDIVHSLPELAALATTSDGQERILGWLSGSSQNTAEDVLEFWAVEFIADA